VTTLDQTDRRGDDGESARPAVPGALRAAAVASLGAGAIHATAAGSHGDHRSVVVVFAVVAAAQIGWGALALVWSGRWVGLAGVVVNGAAVGGWLMAKTSGIGFVSGLEAAEGPEFADSLAAGLAAVAVVGAVAALATRGSWVARPHPALVGVAGAAALALAVPGMVSAGGHSHVDGHGHDAGHDMAAMEGMDHSHAEAVSVARPYTATLPVDLGGVAGVTAEQQQAAEDVVTRTIEKLPQFSDWTTLEQRGWYSIHDAFGPESYEHFVNWPLLEDGKLLDPDQPETLVFQNHADGSKTLVAAMYQTSRSVALEDVPDVGGKLMQWHIHNDLCFAGEENKWRVAGLAPPPQECRAGTFKLTPPAPMIHVWIVPNECGPFAALDGIGAGQIAAGEQRLCDHAHGSPG
jgi:hypothetical protein